MFAYLKYFFLSSLILIICASGFFTWFYKDRVTEILRTQSEYSNEAILSGFENGFYKKYSHIIHFFEGPDPSNPDNKNLAEEDQVLFTPEARQQYGEFTAVFTGINNYLEEMPVIAAGFYAPSQELRYYYPYDGGEKFALAKKVREKRTLGVVEKITFTETQHQVIHDVTYLNPEGKKQTGSVMHSIKPVFDSEKNLVGALEVFVSMSNTSNALNEFQYTGGIFIISVFVILLAALYWIVRRAEKIISKQYDVNMELQSAKVAAESENEQKSQFLANISHELRTPLNAIIGFSEIMKDEILGAIGNDQYKNYVSDIHIQGVHLLSLINDILDFSKAEAGKLDLELEELDLNKLIKSSMRTQEPRAGTGEIELLADLPSQHIVISSDAKRLKQIMLNLLSNAVKFTPPKGRVTVSAWESAIDGNVLIEVKDTGIGIDAKDIAKALAPFGQVDSELSRRYEGTGLGLPLTKKFIELMGGTMNMESAVGEGTKITVILPKGLTLSDASNSNSGTSEAIESTSDNFESFQKPKLYISEDSDDKDLAEKIANPEPEQIAEMFKEEPKAEPFIEPTVQQSEEPKIQMFVEQKDEPAAKPFDKPAAQEPQKFETITGNSRFKTIEPMDDIELDAPPESEGDPENKTG